MRMLASATILAAGLLASAAPATAAAPIKGKWYTKDKRAIVTIEPCGKTMCGRLTRFIQPPKNGVTTDINNPEPAMKKRKLIGIRILSDFVADGDKWHGKIYDPESGKTYRSVVSHGQAGTLSVEGCVAMFCQAQTWTPAK
jgi:uncharacterized protein (DUF2147 family)